MSDPQVQGAKPVPAWRKPMAWMKKLYDWVLHWAETPYGTIALFVLAFAESSFFPIPPDVLLIALCLGGRSKAFFFAGVCAVGSVLGGVFGWWLGHEFFGVVNSIVAWIVGPSTWYGTLHEGAEVVALSGFEFYRYAADSVFASDTSIFLKVKAMYDENAFMAIFTAAFTPIPYKVFTVAGGYFGVSLLTLVVASAVGRSARFFLVAGMLYLFGPPVKRFIDKYFDWLALLFTVLLIGGFIVLKKVM